ncbi:uncharacterized protein CDV56_106654 [Aspergillus thermomutatus]|uniref:Amino acid permease/ SLC12A domain-containing protein n=1 Tax=Aspergillus thermomutatus TaxID=41047 RepID=A0A397I2R3_ASPTH|nr:uncharacterized protein CDV56_106654 [Aspergillus thermomutatus]RHZ67140.1 hypothetical protein CDV56_106654 [Aspergillus thermomutatus]
MGPRWRSSSFVLSAVVALLIIRVYDELEFVFAILKILLITGVVLTGLVINLGGVPGSLPRLWAVLTTLVCCFSGVDSLTMAAAEMHNPRQNIPRACKRVFARVTIFYVVAVLIVGMIVPSNDPRLSDESGTAAQSPFVIAAVDAGIKAVPSRINAIVLTSAWSASNQSILAGTRTLYGLALKGHAPAVFLRTTRHGVPYICAALQIAVSSLAYLSCSNGALTVFYWLLDLTSSGVLVSWGTIALNDIRLLKAFKAQRISLGSCRGTTHGRVCFPLAELDICPVLQQGGMTDLSVAIDYTSWFALIACIVILLTGGFCSLHSG